MWFSLLLLLAAAGEVKSQSSCSRYPEFPNSATGKCEKDVLGKLCLDVQSNSCEFAIVNAGCDPSGICSCSNGYQETKSIAGERYCTLVTEGTVCEPGAEGNRICRLALQDAEAMCELNSCSCRCPQGKAFTGTQCEFRIFTSQNPVCDPCERSGGVCFDSNGDTVPDGCHCPGKSFSSGVTPDDQLAFGCNGVDSDIEEQCSRGLVRETLTVGGSLLPGVLCRDPNAECVHIGLLSGRHVCRCRPGYVPVSHSPIGFTDSPQSSVCHKQLTADEDPDCRHCTTLGGQCYDINGDGTMDGCLCPSTRSTTTDDLPTGYCNFQNVEVECNNSTMRICLVKNDGLINIPPKINDIIEELETGKAVAHIRGRGNDSRCHLEKHREGVYCIDLRTDETVPGTFYEICGGLVVKPDKKQTSYMTWIVVLRNMTKMTMNDFCLHAYCTYDDIKCVSNGTLIKEPKHIAGTGKKLCPIIRLSLEDKFDEVVDFSPVPIGSLVRLVVEYVDDLGGTYTHLRPEICILSNLPHLDIPGVKTVLFIDHGALVENGYISLGANFKPDLQNSRLSRTGFFRMCMFEDSQYIFFHCAVRVCRSPEPCQPLITKRKRRSVAHDGPISLPETLAELEASGEYQRVEFKAKLPSERELAIAEARERMTNPYLSSANLAVQVVRGDDYEEKIEAIDRARIMREENKFLHAENRVLSSERENVVRGDDYEEKIEAIDRARIMRENKFLHADNRVLSPERENVKVRKVPEPTFRFSTVLAVICVGTAALTFALALGSFYLVTAFGRRTAKEELSSG